MLFGGVLVLTASTIAAPREPVPASVFAVAGSSLAVAASLGPRPGPGTSGPPSGWAVTTGVPASGLEVELVGSSSGRSSKSQSRGSIGPASGADSGVADATVVGVDDVGAAPASAVGPSIVAGFASGVVTATGSGVGSATGFGSSSFPGSSPGFNIAANSAAS